MKWMRWLRLWVLCALAGVVLAGCFGGDGGSSDDDSSGTSPAPNPPAVLGTVQGRVQSAADGSAVAGATVDVAGVRATTADDGSFTLQAPVGARSVARVEAPGFAPTVRITAVQEGQASALTAQLLPVAASATVTVAAGADVTVPGTPALVRLPAAGLVRSDGGAAAASVTVSVTPINPALNAGLMPGDFTAGSAEAPQIIESFGAMQIDIRDASGAAYNLAPNRTATLRIPLASRSANIPATVPLFYMDTTTGRWVQEGTATLQGSGADRYYEGTVSHFSTWNADQAIETIRLTGCVRDANNQPVAGALVSSDGIDYSGSSRAATGADGGFIIPVKRGGVLTLAALTGDRLTNTLRVEAATTAADATLPNCLVTAFTTAGINIKLTWGAKPEDVDSHLLVPDGAHVYFAAPGDLVAAPFANLDVDDTDSFGPEVVTITRLMQGTYRYAVHNYSGTFDPGMTGSPVRVELSRGGALNVFTPPAGEGSNGWWHVFDLVVDANCAVTLVPVNTWLADQPPPAAVSNPVLCAVN